MANTVKLKRSAVAGKVPATTDLSLGELALNTNDGVLFFKRDLGGTESIVKVATTTNLLSYTRVTTSTTAVTRQAYIADTSGGTFTITLPASPSTGDWVTIVDGASFLTTPLTIGRNSSTIADVADNLSLNIEGVSVTLVYDGSTWEVYTQVGANGGDQAGLVTGSSTTTFTNKTISGSSNTLSNIGNSSLTNSSVTINGSSVSLGGSATVTAAAGTLTGSTLASGVTASSLTSVGTLTGLTINSSTTTGLSITAQTSPTHGNTATWQFIGNGNIGGPNAWIQFPDSSIQTTAYTGNAATVTNGVYTTDTGTVTNTMLAGSITNAKLVNSSVTVNGSSISLGSSATVTAAAGTLTGTTLNSTVVTSSLTSVGTLDSLAVTNNATISGQVITPNRTGFRVSGSGTTNNLTTSQNTYGAINSNNFTVDFQQGTSLNTTTGVFTAPTTGLYQVNIVGRNAGYSGGISQLGVTKNGSSGGLVGGTCICMIEFAASSSMNHAGASTVIKLTAGDTLACKILAGQINFDGNDNWSIAFLG